MPWMKVCAVGALGGGDSRLLPVKPPVAVFNSDGAYYAIDDTCTHETASLADGWVEGATVACPLHQATFCLRTGEALTPPAYLPVRTHSTKVEGGDLYVDLPNGS